MFKQIGKQLSRIGDQVSKWFGNLIDFLTGSDMTDAEREAAATSYSYNSRLADEDYQRKIDFYERYESPAAQVRQYKDAGLNPALMYQGGASVSASGGVGSGSVSADSGANPAALISLVSALAGVAQRQRQVNVDARLRSFENETRRMDVENQRLQIDTYREYLESQKEGRDLENDLIRQTFPDRVDAVKTQTSLLKQQLRNEEVRNDLLRSNISLNDAEKALRIRQEAILAAQEKYADKYYKAAAEYEQCVASMASAQSKYEWDTLDRRKKVLDIQIRNMILEGGIASKTFGYMSQDNLRKWLDVGGKVVGIVGGSALAAGKIAGRAATKSVVPPFFEGTIPKDFSGYGDRMY